MLKDLQSLFKNTWAAFRSELARREPEDEVADLLVAMRREMVEARATVPQLESVVQHAEAELRREREELARTERRRTMAERIADAETVRVASEFVTRHTERIGVLERKLEAARAELNLQKHEVEEMSRRYKEAEANRFGLLAELRRQRARDQMQGTLEDTGVFGDFSRVEEGIRESSAYAEALEELQDLDRAGGPAAGRNPPDVEEKLRELKRRMQNE